jgi:pantoate kinase
MVHIFTAFFVVMRRLSDMETARIIRVNKVIAFDSVAVRLIQEMYVDPEWCKRLAAVHSFAEVAELAEEYAKQKGYPVKREELKDA